MADFETVGEYLASQNRHQAQDGTGAKWCERCQKCHKCETCGLSHDQPRHITEHLKMIAEQRKKWGKT